MNLKLFTLALVTAGVSIKQADECELKRWIHKEADVAHFIMQQNTMELSAILTIIIWLVKTRTIYEIQKLNNMLTRACH
jgi:hypothetical protein